MIVNRTRVRSIKPVVVTGVLQYWYWSPSRGWYTAAGNPPSSSDIESLKETMVDFKRPFLPKVARKGSLSRRKTRKWTNINDCDHTSLQRVPAPGTLFYSVYPGSGYDTTAEARLASSQKLIASPTPAPYKAGFATDLVGLALEELAAKSGDQMVEPILPFIGEFRQCISAIRNPLAFLHEAVNRIPRKPLNMRKVPLVKLLAQSGMSATTGGWLSYRYGWAPLLSDIEHTMHALIGVNEQYETYLSRNVGSRREVAQSRAAQSAHTYTQTADTVTKHLARCKLWGVFTPEPSTLSYFQFLQARMGLRPRDVIPAAWELVPWSFVADWFFPIGDTISRITSTPVNFTVTQSMYDYTRTTEQKQYLLGPTGQYAGKPVKQLLCTVTEKKYLRDSIPIIAPDSPSWFTTKRALDAFALIAQALKFPVGR